MGSGGAASSRSLSILRTNIQSLVPCRIFSASREHLCALNATSGLQTQENWNISQPFGAGRFAMLQAIVAIGYRDEIEPWLIGQAAWLAWGEKKGSGFSPGASADETTRRKNWASCASKARHKWNLDALTDQLDRFRKDGGEPASVSWQEMIARCDHLIRHGSAGESLRAIELKTKLTGKDDQITARQLVKMFVAAVGPERTKLGLADFGAGNLTHAAPELFEDHDARPARLEQELLEDGNEQSRPVARRAGADTRNLDSGGSRRISDDAAREVDEGPRNAGSVGAGQRPVGSGDIERRLSELEKLELEACL